MDFGEVFEKIGFEWQMAVINGINFLIFFYLLNRFVFGKVGRTLHERQDKIEKSIIDAENLEKEVAEANKKSASIIAEAEKEANLIVQEHKEKAKNEAEKIKEEAKDEISKMESKSKQKIANDKVEMIKEIKAQTADLAILATEKIISEKLDSDEDNKLINDYLDKIDE